ncbi:DUF4267 domain-containing protein [Nonomuraea sp. NPDC050547]|uniref:DUF4267 domain-containing protein n=1 Tax=unclassified Nonomuraea TaxID=2593643 RepID=UPI0037892296
MKNNARALRVTAAALTWIAALMIGYVGFSYLFTPMATAPSFGLPAWPGAEAAGFLNVKGVRDVVSGLIPLALLLSGQRRALGWSLAVISLIPFGDAAVILANGGSVMAALAIHTATAVVVLATAALHLRISVISQNR